MGKKKKKSLGQNQNELEETELDEDEPGEGELDENEFDDDELGGLSREEVNEIFDESYNEKYGELLDRLGALEDTATKKGQIEDDKPFLSGAQEDQYRRLQAQTADEKLRQTTEPLELQQQFSERDEERDYQQARRAYNF